MHEDYDVLSPQRFHGLWVYPVTRSEQAPDYVPLPSALEDGTIIVAEARSARVPTIDIEVRSPGNYVALSGTLLRGGRQNRAIRRTQVWDAPGQAQVDVRCIEERRWSHSTGAFRAETVAPPSIRAALSRGSQADVWAEVTNVLDLTGTLSNTRSLLDDATLAINTAPRRRQPIDPPPSYPGERTIGYVAMDGATPIAAEFVCNDRIAECYWSRWMRGLGATAPRQAGRRPDNAKRHIRDLVRHLETVARRQGGLHTGVLDGEATYHNDTLVHLVAWPATAPTLPFHGRIGPTGANPSPYPDPSCAIPSEQAVVAYVAAGDEHLELLELQRGHHVTIGRDDRCGLRLSDGTVSRSHAQLGLDDDGVPWFEDMGSSNGSALNGIPLQPRDRVALRVGDDLDIAHGGCIRILTPDPAELERRTCAFQRARHLGDTCMADRRIEAALQVEAAARGRCWVALIRLDRLDLIERWRGAAMVNQLASTATRLVLEAAQHPDLVWRTEHFETVLLMPDSGGSPHERIAAVQAHLRHFRWDHWVGQNARANTSVAPLPADAAQGLLNRLRQHLDTRKR